MIDTVPPSSESIAKKRTGATKHHIGHIGVQIMLLLDMTQYKVIKGKRLGSVLVKQFSQAQPGWGLRI